MIQRNPARYKTEEEFVMCPNNQKDPPLVVSWRKIAVVVILFGFMIYAFHQSYLFRTYVDIVYLNRYSKTIHDPISGNDIRLNVNIQHVTFAAQNDLKVHAGIETLDAPNMLAPHYVVSFNGTMCGNYNDLYSAVYDCKLLLSSENDYRGSNLIRYANSGLHGVVVTANSSTLDKSTSVSTDAFIEVYPLSTMQQFEGVRINSNITLALGILSAALAFVTLSDIRKK